MLARIVAALAAAGLRVLVGAHTHRAVNNALRMVAIADASLSVIKAGKASGADDLKGTRVGVAPSVSRLPAGRDPRRAVVVGEAHPLHGITGTDTALRGAWQADRIARAGVNPYLTM